MHISRVLFLPLTLLTVASFPVACVPKQLPPALTMGLERGKTDLKFVFDLPVDRPSFFNEIKKIKIVITPRVGSATEDLSDFTVSENASELSRELKQVNTGNIEILVQLLDANDTVIQSVTRSSSINEKNPEPFVVTVAEKLTLELPNALAAMSLSQLLQAEQDLLSSIQSLEQQRSILRGQTQALAGSNAPEDRAMREQLQSEIQVIENKLTEQNAELTQIKATALNAQSNLEAQAGATDKLALSNLQTSYNKTRSEIQSLIEQRGMRSAELNAEIGAGDAATQQALQAEMDTLNQQIESKFIELKRLATELTQVQTRIDANNASLSDTDRKIRLESEIQSLEKAIAGLEIQIQDLNTRIEVLVPATDQMSIDRRDALEREKANAEKSLAEKKTALSAAQKRLEQL